MLNNYRRRILLALSGFVMSQTACTRDDNTAATAKSPLSPEDTRLKHKFRGIGGGERIIDAIVRMDRVALYNEKDGVIETGSFSPQRRSTSSYGGGDFVVPKTIRMMYHGPWDGEDSPVFGNEAGKYDDRYSKPPPFFKGTPLADVTVPVAERIPEAVLDEIRARGGSLQLRLRLTPKTLLVAWEIERRPGYTPGSDLHYPPYFLMSGGDFQNEYPVSYYQAENGAVKSFGPDLRKGLVPLPPELAAKGYFLKEGDYDGGQYQLRRQGWYIDPETGKKIVTDF